MSVSTHRLSQAGRPLFWALVAALLVGVAAWLRLQQITDQVLIDDEWHALQAVLSLDYTGIWSSFGRADRSIPLTLLYQLMTDTIGLTELRMRLPSLIAGLGIVVFGVAWAWRRLPPTTTLLFGWLLATAPLLVIYARLARPYEAVVVLAMVGFLLAHRWWYDRCAYCLFWYALCVALGGWLQPLFGPFLLAPLVYYLAATLLAVAGDSRWRDELQRLLSGGVIVAALSAPLVLYPLFSDPAAILEKAGQGGLSWETLHQLAYLLAGTGYGVVVVLFLGLAVIGLVVILRRYPQYAGFGAVALVLFAATLLIARPAWMSTGYVFARYALPILPGLLLLVALGAVAIVEWIQPKPIRLGAVAVLAGFLVVGSPLPQTWKQPTSYSSHTYYIADFGGDSSGLNGFLRDMPQSPLWQQLPSEIADDAPLALAPWRFEAPLSPLPVLERQTGRRILPAFIDGYCSSRRYGEVPAGTPGIHLQNALQLNADPPPAWRNGYLIWKRRWYIDPQGQRALADHGLFVTPLRERLLECERQIRRDFGPPVYQDQWLALYSLGGTGK